MELRLLAASIDEECQLCCRGHVVASQDAETGAVAEWEEAEVGELHTFA
jgi:hypothetical protein